MTSFDLFKGMGSFTREMDQVFRDFGFGLLLEQSLDPNFNLRSYPRINLHETKEAYLLEVQLPGIDPKELEMTVLKGTLTLSGERKEAAHANGSWHRRERGHGKFMRAVDIPAEIDVEKVHAEYRDGVLKISLPKAESVLPKRIEIKAN